METISQISIVEQDEKITSTYQKEKGRLLNYIRKNIPDPIEAEDLLQDVFFEFTASMRVPESIERTTSWLFAVTKNKIIDLFRKKKTLSFSSLETTNGDSDGANLILPLLLLESDDLPEKHMMNELIEEALDAALEKLPEAQRWVFVQHEIEGMSFQELAEMTGEGVNTLISRKRYAVLFLRAELQALYNELINN